MTTFKTRHLSVAQNLTSRLEDIVLGNPTSIRAYVAREAINYCDDSPSQMFADLNQGGCLSGTIPSLITYADTHEFFNQYYDEIEAMREAFEDNTGEPLQIGPVTEFYRFTKCGNYLEQHRQPKFNESMVHPEQEVPVAIHSFQLS